MVPYGHLYSTRPARHGSYGPALPAVTLLLPSLSAGVLLLVQLPPPLLLFVPQSSLCHDGVDKPLVSALIDEEEKLDGGVGGAGSANGMRHGHEPFSQWFTQKL